MKRKVRQSGALSVTFINASARCLVNRLTVGLAVDIVKIDGTYVHDAQKSAKGKAFLKSMATLCGDLGIITVGEMVETVAMADLLIEAGVDYGQGWLFGKPSVGMTTTRQVAALRARAG